MTATRYRPEVDGLRAIAVVPVILFHAGIGGFGGGYVGVDVFFVISGYLITTIIINECDQGRFRLIRFYERRARRILPALFFVILLCLPMAWIWLLPRDMKDFGQSVVAVVTFSSNILFWLESDYFARAAELKPLLHTWSLAVEEQYYIGFPLLLLLAWRLGKRAILAILSAVFLLSLALAHWAAYSHPVADFFLLPTRAWELLIGVFIAFFLQRREVGLAPGGQQALSLAGLAMIAAAVFLYGRSTPFPSLYALLPTVGTGLIILFANEGTIAHKVLSSRGLVGIGLISYSAYLWHQPLLAFARHAHQTEIPPGTVAGLILLSFALAYLTWRFIETPFRSRSRVGGRALVLACSSAVLFLAPLGVYAHLQQGFYGRFDAKLQAIDDVIEENWRDQHSCTFEDREVGRFDQVAGCYVPGKTIYLIGDSHAGALSKALRSRIEASGYSFIALLSNGCLPIRGTSREPPQRKCGAFVDWTEDVVRKLPGVMIMSARWRLNLMGPRFDNLEGGVEHGSDGKNHVVGDRQADIVSYTERKLRDLAALRPLFIIDQIPEAGWNVPSLMIKRMRSERENEEPLSTSYETYKTANSLLLPMFDRLDHAPNIHVVGTAEIVCSEDHGRCLNERQGRPLYRDDDHPSLLFAELIAEAVMREVDASSARLPGQ